MYLKGNEITKRNIKVLDIDNENIKAFCFLRNQKRIFKIEIYPRQPLYMVIMKD